ncbi:hypothetical protein NA56DRAFT_272871 [Hyaloscypha hepaticicola]|uniref:Secreted protein n=1 Tax=Hyaloscypha hepaticicola TaxID=2082293 RepID=A0A2J6PUJ9_9HELO|nr:hypothetical protein NA56DRAFT_272871 [Hyaloscypha hepaticicola]
MAHTVLPVGMLLGATVGTRTMSTPKSPRCNFNSTLIRPLVLMGRLQGRVHTTAERTAERGRSSRWPPSMPMRKSILRIPWSPALHLSPIPYPPHPDSVTLFTGPLQSHAHTRLLSRPFTTLQHPQNLLINLVNTTLI